MGLVCSIHPDLNIWFTRNRWIDGSGLLYSSSSSIWFARNWWIAGSANLFTDPNLSKFIRAMTFINLFHLTGKIEATHYFDSSSSL